MSDHPVEPDGYCPTCGTVGCLQRAPRAGRRPTPPTSDQLNRIESKLNRILRHIGIDPENNDEGAPDARHQS